MTICKYCSVEMDWGYDGERYVPLVPIALHDDLDRTFQDENGVLRAHHHQVCTRVGGPVVHVTKLARKVRAAELAKSRESVDAITGEITLRDPA